MHPNLHKAFRWLPILLVVGIALFLRLYRLPETVMFDDDQGMDMVIVWHMEHADHGPLIGPFLSLPDVYTPPTYYYITWLFYHFTHTVTGVVYGYAVLNILTLLFLMKLAYDMAGRRTAIIAGSLFTVSLLMVKHGRLFWQPYPIQFFLALYLLGLWHAFGKKNLLLLWISTLWFQFALSVYPSPIMLLPFVIYQLIRWYRSIAKQSGMVSVLYAAVTFFLTFGVAFAPQIIFELTHSFPTIHTLLSTDTGQLFSITHPLITIGLNIFNVYSGFISTNRLPHMWTYVITGTYIVVFIILSYCNRPAKHISVFFAPLALIAGLGFLVFYPYDITQHRMWTYLPFLFLYSAIIFSQTLHKSLIHKIIAGLLMVTFIGFNLEGNRIFWTGNTYDALTRTKAIARYIYKDMDARNITDRNTGLFYKIPNDPLNGSYRVYRILYWLLENKAIVLSVAPKGNVVTFDYSRPVYKRHMYILCYNFGSPDTAERECVDPVVGTHPYILVHRAFMYNTYIFLLKREDIPDSSGNSIVTPPMRQSK